MNEKKKKNTQKKKWMLISSSRRRFMLITINRAMDKSNDFIFFFNFYRFKLNRSLFFKFNSPKKKGVWWGVFFLFLHFLLSDFAQSWASRKQNGASESCSPSLSHGIFTPFIVVVFFFFFIILTPWYYIFFSYL